MQACPRCSLKDERIRKLWYITYDGILFSHRNEHIWFSTSKVDETRVWNRGKSEKQIPYRCCSVARSCPGLCNTMDCSTPGFPVLHYLPEFAQIHIHWVNDIIQTTHPLFPSCLQSFLVWGSLPKNHLFASGNQNIGASASIRPLTIQGWLPLGLTGLTSL